MGRKIYIREGCELLMDGEGDGRSYSVRPLQTENLQFYKNLPIPNVPS